MLFDGVRDALLLLRRGLEKVSLETAGYHYAGVIQPSKEQLFDFVVVYAQPELTMQFAGHLDDLGGIAHRVILLEKPQRAGWRAFSDSRSGMKRSHAHAGRLLKCNAKRRGSAASKTGGIMEKQGPPSGFNAPEEAEWHRQISEAAYHLAEKRNFEPGAELDDWLAAEAAAKDFLARRLS